MDVTFNTTILHLIVPSSIALCLLTSEWDARINASPIFIFASQESESFILISVKESDPWLAKMLIYFRSKSNRKGRVLLI